MLALRNMSLLCKTNSKSNEDVTRSNQYRQQLCRAPTNIASKFYTYVHKNTTVNVKTYIISHFSNLNSCSFFFDLGNEIHKRADLMKSTNINTFFGVHHDESVGNLKTGSNVGISETTLDLPNEELKYLPINLIYLLVINAYGVWPFQDLVWIFCLQII